MKPPLEMLRVFEAAARRGSFKEAARELSITAAAVSQRIRGLEESLGVQLFRRQTRRVVLTEEGKLLAEKVSEGLHSLDEGIQAVALRRKMHPLTISTTTTFADQCLLPILGEFDALHPEMVVRVLVSNDLVDFAAERIDLAVRQGNGQYRGCDVHLLFPGRYVPVCAPWLFDRRPRAPLIHVDWPVRPEIAPTWVRWFAYQGEVAWASGGGVRVPYESMAIRGALAGHGLALVELNHVRHELERGDLVRPFGEDAELQIGFGHFLVRPQEKPRAAAMVMWEWLSSRFAT